MGEPVNKQELSERDICTKYIVPALEGAGWDRMLQMREEFEVARGRIIVRGEPTAVEEANPTDIGRSPQPDLHRPIDASFASVMPKHRTAVSRRIREEFENGRDYYRYHGQALATIPRNRAEQPDAGYLTWHNEHLFRG